MKFNELKKQIEKEKQKDNIPLFEDPEEVTFRPKLNKNSDRNEQSPRSKKSSTKNTNLNATANASNIGLSPSNSSYLNQLRNKYGSTRHMESASKGSNSVTRSSLVNMKKPAKKVGGSNKQVFQQHKVNRFAVDLDSGNSSSVS